MSLNSNTAVDHLSRMVQVIQADANLREWFFAMARKAAVERRNEIFQMVEQMRAGGEEPNLVASFQLLADQKIFEAAFAALQGDKLAA